MECEKRFFKAQVNSWRSTNYKRAAQELFEKLLPDTERLPERREEWDDFYEPDDRREAPDYIHLADVTIQNSGEPTQVRFWRGRLCAVSSFGTE